MRRMLAATAATTMLAAGAIVAAPQAHAATCSVTGYAPNRVVVGLSPVNVRFSVQDDCPGDKWAVLVNDGMLAAYEEMPTFTVQPSQFESNEAGRYGADVVALDDTDTSDDGGGISTYPFYLQRNSVITFNATPETRSAKKTVKGKLTRASWSYGKYVAWGGRTGEVQFKAPGGSYTKISTVTTRADGTYSKSVTIPRTGTLRVVFPMISTTDGSTSTGDSVPR